MGDRDGASLQEQIQGTSDEIKILVRKHPFYRATVWLADRLARVCE